MDIQPDFRELFTSFNAHGVEFLVVGGYALAFHGSPRYTGDIDVLVHPGAENAARIMASLSDFGFGATGLSADDFLLTDQVVQLGVPPVRVDLLTSITGVSWEEAWNGAEPGEYGGVPVRYLGRAALLRNKKALGRKKDLADLESLGE